MYSVEFDDAKLRSSLQSQSVRSSRERSKSATYSGLLVRTASSRRRFARHALSAVATTSGGSFANQASSGARLGRSAESGPGEEEEGESDPGMSPLPLPSWRQYHVVPSSSCSSPHSPTVRISCDRSRYVERKAWCSRSFVPPPPPLRPPPPPPSSNASPRETISERRTSSGLDQRHVPVRGSW